MTKTKNITSAFIVVIFTGYLMVFIYAVLIHKFYQQHSLIHIHLYKSHSDRLNSLLEVVQKNLEINDHRKQTAKQEDVGVKVQQTKPKLRDLPGLPDLDLMKWKQPKFHQDYRNPCWYNEDVHYKPTRCRHGVLSTIKIKPTTTKILRCLPYFYIVGQPRSGLTNIYNRLIQHPDIIAPPHKDIFWIQRHRFAKGCSTVNTYLDYFHGVAEKISLNSVKHKKSNLSYHSKITGDCSGDILWDNSRWLELPGNRDCQQPCLTNADYIKHLNPSAKIIMSLRDPVERLYSDYLAQSVWLKYTPNNEEFDRLVTELINSFNKCVEDGFTLRTCLYNPNLQNAKSKVRLGIGIYHIYLEDWMKIFPRNQIHIIHFEYYTKNTAKELSRLFRFLGLRQLNQAEMGVVMANLPTNRRTKQAEDSVMWKETRDNLELFYDKYNEALSNMLKDKKFLWDS